MTKIIEKTETAEHKAAERCPYYDDDCKDVRDHVACWSLSSEPFPGVCPFVFGMKQ